MHVVDRKLFLQIFRVFRPRTLRISRIQYKSPMEYKTEVIKSSAMSKTDLSSVKDISFECVSKEIIADIFTYCTCSSLEKISVLQLSISDLSFMDHLDVRSELFDHRRCKRSYAHEVKVL
jgi:hypothetical protein